MHTICQKEPIRSIINALPRSSKKPTVLFFVYNADGMFVARFHVEAMAQSLAKRIGGRVTAETVLI